MDYSVNPFSLIYIIYILYGGVRFFYTHTYLFFSHTHIFILFGFTTIFCVDFLLFKCHIILQFTILVKEIQQISYLLKQDGK